MFFRSSSVIHSPVTCPQNEEFFIAAPEVGPPDHAVLVRFHPMLRLLLRLLMHLGYLFQSAYLRPKICDDLVLVYLGFYRRRWDKSKKGDWKKIDNRICDNDIDI